MKQLDLFSHWLIWTSDSVTLLYFQFKYGKISSKHNGSVKKGVIFATYSSLIGESQSGGKYKTRFEQLLHWCGEDFDGVVSFSLKLFDDAVLLIIDYNNLMQKEFK